MHSLNPEHVKSITVNSNDHGDNIEIALKMPRPAHVPKPPQLIGCPKSGFHFSFLEDEPPCPACSKYYQEKEEWKKEAVKALGKPDVVTTLEVTGYGLTGHIYKGPNENVFGETGEFLGVTLSIQTPSGESLNVILPQRFYAAFHKSLKGVEATPVEAPRDPTRLDRLLNDESV